VGFFFGIETIILMTLTCSTGSRGSAEEKLLIGSYKGAFPHIGEACFQAEAEKTVVIIIRHFKKPVSLKG
jgi:hypothetical protein